MAADASPQTVTDILEMRRAGRFGFPAEELLHNSAVVASLGRDSSLNIFFGRGRKALLADGTLWRIRAATSGRHIVPVVRSTQGTVAYSGPLYAKRTYGITGRDWGYSLIPTGRIGLRRPGHWTLRRHGDDIAVIDDRRKVIRSTAPLPLAASLLIFTLINHGIPGEADLLPRPG